MYMELNLETKQLDIEYEVIKEHINEFPTPSRLNKVPD